ncbi:NYN domain-containing protein [Microbacterium faecale]|nr:NYN domain-containing protein [Microbacterium faecale]
MTLRASVVIDYQNVHLTAYDVFNRRGERHDSLIHPMQFAHRSIAERNRRQREGYALATLHRTIVCRGLPHADYDWEQNRRCLDQKTEWEAAGAEVHLRDLKYDFERDARGRPILDIHGKRIPQGRPREKGIDVLCALACLREAARIDVDVVILASRDTDLVPALDEVYDHHTLEPQRYARIETASWHNPTAQAEGNRHFGSLRATSPRRIWNTNLDRACYEASLDRRDYR